MSNELETAAGGSVGAFLRRLPRQHVPTIGAPCANCATPLQGPWCHACGQSAEDFHRSIFRLAAEVIEGLFHFDGRLWRTLPDLLFRPGRLTRAYLEGHRAPQIPPLRLFLVVLLAIFLVGGLISGAKSGNPKSGGEKPGGGTSGRADSAAAANARAPAASRTHGLMNMTPEERENVRAKLGKMHVELGGDKPNAAATNWLRTRLNNTLDQPERFLLIMEAWSERFAFLMLPFSTLMLSMLFIFQRQFYLFDHTIFSLHSLSAMGVVLIVAMALTPLIGDDGFILLFPAPVHLFMHLRGVYRTSVAGTLLRMFLLFVGSLIAAVLLIVGLVAVGLNGMGD